MDDEQTTPTTEEEEDLEEKEIVKAFNINKTMEGGNK